MATAAARRQGAPLEPVTHNVTSPLPPPSLRYVPLHPPLRRRPAGVTDCAAPSRAAARLIDGWPLVPVTITRVTPYATPRPYGGAPDADFSITQGAPPPPAVAYRCRVSAQFASVPACTGTRRFGLRSTGRKSRRGAAPRPGAVHRSAGLSRGHLRAQQLRQSPGMLCPPGARGTGLPFARTGIATLKTA